MGAAAGRPVLDALRHRGRSAPTSSRRSRRTSPTTSASASASPGRSTCRPVPRCGRCGATPGDTPTATSAALRRGRVRLRRRSGTRGRGAGQQRGAGSTRPACRSYVVVEAYNLSCGFIDADGLHTDDELWGLIGAFGHRMPSGLGQGHPAGAPRRRAGRRQSLVPRATLGAARHPGCGRRPRRRRPDRPLRPARGPDRPRRRLPRPAAVAHRARRGRDASAPWCSARWTPPGSAPARPGRPPRRLRRSPPQPRSRRPTPAPALPPARPLDELLAELDALVGLRRA